MVGLVVVSHSAKAAEGICDIADQMGGEDATIVPAGGGPDDSIGTSADDIADAIADVAAAESESEGEGEGRGGVVVLVDLGSAVMNAELAIEMTDADATIADAPLLEGALNAAVEAASSKATRESVVAAAEEAREIPKL